MALQKFDDLWFRIALSEQAESRGTASRRKPENPVPNGIPNGISPNHH
ncbi:MAG: hypothetical protein ACLUP8_06655 [Ruminococcus sp.]